MKINKKKLMLFGLPILALCLVTAGLLTVYGQIHQKYDVEQGLTIDGNAWNVAIKEDRGTNSLENPVFTSVHYLDNTADVDVKVELVTTCSPVSDSYSCVEIEDGTNIYETNLRSGTLTLSQKENWIVTGECTDKITVDYSTNVDTGKIVVNSANVPSGYMLVYYKDKEFLDDPTRMGTPAYAYEIVIGQAFSISPSDGNLKDAANYCVKDGYEYCRGIKIWAVPTEAYVSNSNTLKWLPNWNGLNGPSLYYYETELLGWNHIDGELSNPVEVTSDSELDFVIVSEFPIGTVPGAYTITTEVQPVA